VRLSLKRLAGTAAALGLCASPTLAATTPVAVQPVNPLVAVSVFGTQASAQAVSSQVASTAATAGAAVAAQGEFDQDADSSTGMTTTAWVMIAVDLLIAGLGIYTLFDDHDDDDEESVSPA
jgi:hypothetical protein